MAEQAIAGMDLPARIRPGARAAVSALFLANGLVAGFWSVFVPAVQGNLGIEESLMGILILVGASAGFVGLMLSGLLVARLGSRPVAVAAGLLMAPALLIMAQMESFAPAVAAFVLMFVSISVMDVAMNANGADVEHALGKAVMSSFHGFWSMGGMLGAATGGYILATLGQNGFGVVAFVLVSILVVASAAFLAPKRVYAPEPIKEGRRRFRLPGSLPVYVFGLLAFAAFTAEGSVIDWSAIYLRDELSADVALSGFAFAGFSFAMMVSRFSGDVLRQRIGAVRLLQVSALLAIVGFALSASAASLPVVVGGFLLAGLGCANIVPVVFSAAAKVPGVNPGTGIAIATMFGYFGLLCAPALLGSVGEIWGFSPVYLGFSFVMIVVAIVAGLSSHWLADTNESPPVHN
jgi:MFS family permease